MVSLVVLETRAKAEVTERPQYESTELSSDLVSESIYRGLARALRMLIMRNLLPCWQSAP
jgi:hypothetical protein